MLTLVRACFRLGCIAACGWGTTWSFAAAEVDWPTHQQNVHRNAVVPADIHPERLAVAWQVQSSRPPQPAWYGPAKWDSYSYVRDLHSMRNYDPVFHVVGRGEHVYFGSSVDHSVTCLDAATGDRKWSFFTNGPVRIAPTIADGRLYFGSDDGYAYCIDALTGKLVWKFSPTDATRWIVNDGNYVSQWPVRSGVVVADGTAYFAASLLPWQTSYVVAVDANTGQVDGPERYVGEHEELTLEGPLAMAGGMLIAPQGRVPPVLLRRSNGEVLGALAGGGGAFVVVAGEEVLHGPGNKEGWLTRSSAKSRAQLATHKSARAVVVARGTSYLITQNAVVALDASGQLPAWQTPCENPLAMVALGDYLFVGGVDYVAAFDRETGEQAWEHPVDGRAYGLAYSAGRLLVSTDTGAIYAFGETAEPPQAPPVAVAVAVAVTETSAVEEDVEGLAEILPAGDPPPVGRWVFQLPYVKGATARDLAGDHPATLTEPIRLERLNEVQAIELDGTQATITIADDHRAANLPAETLTAEAWVRVDAPLEWGGILGAVQDNGDDERGWLLGYRGERFSFAVSATGGDAGLTYLIAEEPLVLGGWHHVVGTYDGKEMRLYIDGKLAGTSRAQQGPIDYPPTTPYVIGAYQDSNEHYRMTGRIHEVRLYDQALKTDVVAAHQTAVAERFPQQPADLQQSPEPAFMVEAGPYLEFTGAGEAIVRWQTAEPAPTKLTYRLDQETKTIESQEPTTEHEVRLTGLRHNRVYYYTLHVEVEGEANTTAEYECDTFFNYRLALLARGDSGEQPSSDRARRLLEVAGIDRGLCLDVGIESGELAEQLVASSQLRVIAVSSDTTQVAKLRRDLQKRGLYGKRIVVLECQDLARLPLTGLSANLIVSESQTPAVPREEIERLVAPRGKAVLPADNGRRDEVAFVAPMAVAAGEWSHAYGLADNTAFGGESLSGAQTRDDLAVQWIGRPGPRYQSDRSGRKTPPLSTGGRMYLQGLHRIVAVDCHNGTILWSLETPHFVRVNMPRDSANWCADEDHVYAVMRDRCWKINAATGEVEAMLPAVDHDLPADQYDWGFVASFDELLIGTAQQPDLSATDFWGGEGWYDAVEGDSIKKVCSDRLFVVDKDTRRPRWTYDEAVIINVTITIGRGGEDHAGPGQIWFVECRNPEVLKDRERKIGSQEFYETLRLVSLDLATGEKLWDEPLHITTPDVMISLAYSQGRLALVSSNAESKSFHIYNYAAGDGYQMWSQEVGWGHGRADHGTHLSRPAIVGDRLVVRPGVMSLRTGELAAQAMPVSGCGTYACTTAAMFFRAWSGQDFAMWNFDRGDYTRWKRLRPDCWLSTIPADGLLLSPEGGGGCSCGIWLETSLVFIPKARLGAGRE